MAHSLLLSPVGPTPTWLNKSDKRLSGGSLAPSSITHGKNDRSQAKGEEEDFGQGIDIVYDRLSLKDKSDRTKESDAKNGGDKEKQSTRVLENSMIDIVAVGGLEAHPKQTWIKRRRVDDKEGKNSKSFKDGPSCIADPTMLPKELPNSRIMTFYYASDWRGLGKAEQHQPVSQRVEAVADTLLRELKRLRKHCPKRPIIFLSHSLGGIVVEKAVVLSKLRPEYLEIYHTIAGCVFLGAPFKGSLSQAKAAVVAKAGAIFDLTDYTPLLELTKRNNQHLADMLSDFLEVVNEASIQIFCFYELQKSDMSKFYKSIVPLGGILPEKLELVVDMESSTLQGKEKQGLYRNHFNLNKFESNKEREWAALSSVLTSMAAKAPKALRDRRNALPDKVSSETYLEILTALAAMEVDPDVDVQTIEDDRGQAITDSAALIFRNEKINKWLGATQTGLLWISLHPGMSSAMMAVAFYRHVEEELWDSQLDDYLCYFFCDSKNIKKNNTMSVLKAFVRQMLKTTQRLASHLPFDQQRAQNKKQNVGNSRAWDSFSNLKLAFLAMLRDPLVNSVTIVLDSLHKIDEDNRHEMLGLIVESLNITNSSTGRSKVKWICFSLDRSDIKSTMQVQQALNVTAADLGTPSELVQYLKSLVRDRVVALNKTLRYSREYIFWLKTEILSRAEGNTAWVDLALGEIQKVAPESIDVRSFVENLKQDLNPLYRQIQARVLKPGNEGLEYTKEILRTMMTVFHNPTLQELAVLSGLPPEIWDDQLQIRSYVNRCGSFVKIVRGKRHERVHFTDSTALEYLNQEAANDLGHHDRLSIQHGILALRCLNFLMKPDDEKTSASIRRITYPKEFWLNHAQKACEELPDLVEDFDLNSEFWKAGSPPWWPKLSSLTRLWPTLSNLSVLHLAAYFNFPVLLDHLLGKGSIHKVQVNSQDTLGRTPLYWAAVVGHFNVAQQLVAHGAEINPVFTNDAEGLAPLYGAAEGGHIEILKWLLERGALVDTPNDNYGTALCAAANNGNVEVIDLLLKAGASKFAPSKWIRGSALGSACYFGHPAAAKLLLQAGFEPNVPDADGIYPLVYAIQSRDVELIELFLHKGTNLDSRQNALEAAALNGFEEAIRLILLAPARLSLRQALLDVARLGYTSALDNFPIYALSQRDLDDALYLASDTEKTQVVEKLIFMGANANARGQEYGHALQAAAWDGPEDLVRVLVEHGANVNEMGGRLGTPLQAAAFQGGRGIVEFLLKSGARVNEGPIGEYGNALYAAAAGNNLIALKTLVEYGADVNAYGGELKYALLQSARCANAEMVRYLVEHGADVNRKADDGVNAILLASYTLPEKELRFLYEHGANIHARDQSGNTVLIGCSHCQDLAAVQWLIDVGVDVNAISLDFGSALQAAATTGQEQICELLLKNGADVNQFDDYNPPSLIRSAEIDDRVTFNILLRYGADINFNSHRWGNVIEAAIRGSAAEILGIALEQTGLDVNMLLRDQGSPLHMASLREYSLAVIQLLLSKGADPNVTGGKYHTPLQAAAYAGFSSIVTLYLENGADKSLRGGFYETATNAAAARGKSEILSNFLSEDDGSATNEALHYAIHYHQYEIVETLLDDLNADAMSKGKWGNVFQALSTGLSENEINSDDETANNTDGDREVIADSDDESEDGKKAKDVKLTNKDNEDGDEGEDEDEDGVELTDEEKVQRIDTALRNALKKKGIDYKKLVREPLRSNLNRSKSYAHVMKKRAREEIAAKRANSNKSFGGVATPPVPAVDYSRYASNKNVRDSLDLKVSTGFRDSQYLSGTLPALAEMIQPAQQYHQDSSIHGQITTNSTQQLSETFSPQLNFRAPTLVQARAIHSYRSNTNEGFSLSRNEIVTVLDRPRYEDKWKVQKSDGTIDVALAELFLILTPDATRRSVSPQDKTTTEIPLYVDNQTQRQHPHHINDSTYNGFSSEEAQYYRDDKTYSGESAAAVAAVYEQYQPQQEYQNSNVAYQSQQYQSQQDQSRYSMHQFQGSPIQYNGYQQQQQQQQDGRHHDSYVGPY